MNFFDEYIESINSLTTNSKVITSSAWKKADDNQMIFKSDEAYELGSGTLYAISGAILTSSDEYNINDEVVLIGKDLKDIKKDCNIARIILIKVNDKLMGEKDELYKSIRKIDYIRYHVNLDGVMMRISAFSKRESLRISKNALKENISFGNIGQSLIDAYHTNKAVEKVKIIFIDEDNFDYKKLIDILNSVENITQALDHLLNKVKMDCNTCKLQKICEEVENKYLK